MKRIVFLTVILFLGLLPAGAREYAVSGPEGGLAMKIALPDGFNPDRDECPMVLLMHGIFSSKDFNWRILSKLDHFQRRTTGSLCVGISIDYAYLQKQLFFRELSLYLFLAQMINHVW